MISLKSDFVETSNYSNWYRIPSQEAEVKWFILIKEKNSKKIKCVSS